MNNMDVFLDLDPLDISDESAATSLLDHFKPNLVLIGKRRKQLTRVGISHDTASTALYDQAKDLYCLGYFFSTIIVCRSTAEYLAYEIFIEEIDIAGDQEIILSLAENLDFRRIVNEFLYNPVKGRELIDKNTCEIFNNLYTLGNQWIHPKKHNNGIKIEDESLKAINLLGTLLSQLRDVMKDYKITNGTFVKKADARKKKRPISLR